MYVPKHQRRRTSSYEDSIREIFRGFGRTENIGPEVPATQGLTEVAPYMERKANATN
jgi:hypothetical protein